MRNYCVRSKRKVSFFMAFILITSVFVPLYGLVMNVQAAPPRAMVIKSRTIIAIMGVIAFMLYYYVIPYKY